MSSDQTRAGLLLLEGEGGVLELIPGRFFFSWMTRERREGKKERKKRVDTEKVEKKRKRNQGASIHHIQHIGIHTRKLIFLENRKTIS